MQVQIRVDNPTQKTVILTILLSLGYSASWKSIKMLSVHEEHFKEFNFLAINVATKDIGGNYEFRDNRGERFAFSHPGDFDKFLDIIYNPPKAPIKVEDIGQDKYTATVYPTHIEVGCQRISFGSFDKVATAVAEMRKPK